LNCLFTYRHVQTLMHMQLQNRLYSIFAIWFEVWQIIITAFTFCRFWLTASIYVCAIFSFPTLQLDRWANWQRHLSSDENYTNNTICVVLDHSIVLFQKENKGNAKRGVSPRLKIRPCDLDPLTLKIDRVPDSLKV
jgi:hypothetical protein